MQQLAFFPGPRDDSVYMHVCMLCLFTKIFIYFLTFHKQLEKSLFLVFFMILTLSSFPPYDSQKARECFYMLLPASPPLIKTVCPSVLSMTLARPLDVQIHLQAPWKALSWEHFTLSLIGLLWKLYHWSEAEGGETYGAVGRAAQMSGEVGSGDSIIRFKCGCPPSLVEEGEGGCMVANGPHLQQMSLPWSHDVPKTAGAWLHLCAALSTCTANAAWMQGMNASWVL